MPRSRPREKHIVDAGTHILGGDHGEIAYQHTVLTQCGLPRKRIAGERWERRNGTASLLVRAGELWDGTQWVLQPLPYGTYPRLFSIYLACQILRTGMREVDIGRSCCEMLRRLGKRSSGGANGTLTHFRRQAKALAAASVTLGVPGRHGPLTIHAQPIEEFEAWMVEEDGQTVMWPGTLVVSQEYQATLSEHAVPLAAEAVRGLQESSLELDLYQWLAQRLHRIPHGKPVRLTWGQLRDELAPEYSRIADFKRKAERALRTVTMVYPQARTESDASGERLVLRHSPPPVSYRRMRSDGCG